MTKRIQLPTLLVVTGNPSVRFWIKKHLDEQFFILSAESRSDAIDALNARLDFIILDEEFEEALPLCKTLSQMTQSIVPILLITGRLKKSFRDKALEAGATDFLSNQLDLEELQKKIATGIQTANSRQKTEDFARSIKLPKLPEIDSLKKKIVKRDEK